MTEFDDLRASSPSDGPSARRRAPRPARRRGGHRARAPARRAAPDAPGRRTRRSPRSRRSTSRPSPRAAGARRRLAETVGEEATLVESIAPFTDPVTGVAPARRPHARSCCSRSGIETRFKPSPAGTAAALGPGLSRRLPGRRVRGVAVGVRGRERHGLLGRGLAGRRRRGAGARRLARARRGRRGAAARAGSCAPSCRRTRATSRSRPTRPLDLIVVATGPAAGGGQRLLGGRLVGPGRPGRLAAGLRRPGGRARDRGGGASGRQTGRPTSRTRRPAS